MARYLAYFLVAAVPLLGCSQSIHQSIEGCNDEAAKPGASIKCG